MQYQVDPTDQTPENDQKPLFWLFGSFKKRLPDFSRTCRFRGDFTESLNFHFPPSNVTNHYLHFRQNRLKVEKPLKMAVFGTVS